MKYCNVAALRRLWPVLLCLVAAAATGEAEAPSAPYLGYSERGAGVERGWEARFRAGISADKIRENMRRLSARPHHVGSAYDKDNAEWILSQFKSWGFDAHIETFSVLFPTPKERSLELIQPEPFKASLQEPPVAGDPTSGQSDEQLPTYNAYSADGDVTAPLVYVNYGSREDYEMLDRLGVSVKGAIVIARYGQSWRGIKPKVAAEHGAIGCIIYSDPEGDGFFQGDEYPRGGFRPRQGVQRGSVMDTDYPGDPLTPGIGATSKAHRLKLSEAKTLTKIPVLPISSADALPLLRALQGSLAPESWRGALPITYHIGPGPAVVHLKMISNWDLKPVYDVIAMLRGAGAADQWIIRGNHHDAWVNGAEDPISGQAAMLEEARVLAQLRKQGWAPERTVIYCAWDGEEPGLLGSVEWVETHIAELRAHAAAYINTDDNSRGFLSAGGTQDLQAVLSSVARDVPDPESKLSVYLRAHLKSIADAKDAEERSALRRREDLKLEALGDGSDFTAFQDFAGISTLDLSFGNEPAGDQYHSIYDDFYWFTHFVDPDFVYERALSQMAGSTVMRLADADFLPATYAPQAEAISGYEAELEKLLKDKQDDFAERDRQSKEGLFTALNDPLMPMAPPPAGAIPPYMTFAPMKNAIAEFTRSAEHYAAALETYLAKGSPALSEASLASLNADLMRVPRSFLSAAGLPDRPWFKNQIYAPGAYTGYGAKPIAAVREYMDEKKWREAEGQVPQVSRTIEAAAAAIDRAAADLEHALNEPR